MDINTPNKSAYTNMVTLIRDVFKAYMPKISTAVGSAVYELIVRPLSIVYASIHDSLDKDIRRVSLDTLSTSQNTEIGDVDHILANYFVTRNESKNATGIITVSSQSEVTRIPKGSRFIVAGVDLLSSVDTIGIYPDVAGYTNSDSTVYTKATKIGNEYYFPITVESDQSTAIINAGTPAEVVSDIPATSATVSSAIEGGSAGETDAEMIERARINMCSWQGGDMSIHKILSNSGIKVYSSKSFDAADPEMSRVSGSPVLIGTDGMIDTYVKTAQLPLRTSVTVHLQGTVFCDISSKLPAGVLSITNVTHSSNNISEDFEVYWGSSDKRLTDRGARLSQYQTTSIKVQHTGEYIITAEYMPGIRELQDYVNRSDVRMLGTSVVIKAAIPTTVRIGAVCVPNGHSVDDIREVIKNYINNLPVGNTCIDMANAQDAITTALPGVYIKHPIAMKTSTTTYAGHKSIIGDSVSGIIYSEGTDDSWTGRVRFFCIGDQEVHLEQ